MRHGLSIHWLIAGLATGFSLAFPWGATAWADAPQVTVVSPGGGRQTLALDALAGSENIVDRPYTLRSATGESEKTVTGFSPAAILDAAGADPYGFSYLEVQRPAGGSVLLSRHQALDPDAFADGSPVVFATATGTGFLRPDTEAGDVNASDCFEAPQGISLVLRKGSPLRVKARASTLRVRPGRPVRFSAIVERAGSGESLSYSWYFDDGHSASGGEASHSFAKRGSYDVVVGVTSAGEAAGASAVVTIQVGSTPEGPERKGGGRNESTGAPDHGAAAGPSTESPGGGGSTGASTPVPLAPQPEEERKPRPAERDPLGERVVGELLDPPTGSPPSKAPKPAAARRGRLDGSRGSGGVPAAALGLLATLGLLGTGALIEAGGVAALWPRTRRGGGIA